MGRRDHRLVVLLLAGLSAACVSHPVTHDAAHVQIRVAADDPESPRSVRFDVPASLLVGLPGRYELPLTGQARLATRAIAAEALAARGYCPRGFTGPDGIRFSEDRSRGAFTVHCRG